MKIEQSTVKTAKNATLAFLGGVVALRLLNNKNIALQNFERDYLSPLSPTLTPQEKETLKFAFQATINISGRDDYGYLYEKIKLCLAVKEYEHYADHISINLPSTHKFHDTYIRYAGDRGIINAEIVAGIIIRESTKKRTQRISLLGFVHDRNRALDILLSTHPKLALEWVKILNYDDWLSGNKICIGALQNISIISPHDVLEEFSTNYNYNFIFRENLHACVNFISLIASEQPSQEEIQCIKKIDAVKNWAEPYATWCKMTSKVKRPTLQNEVLYQRDKAWVCLNELLYQKGKAWTCLDEAKGVSMMQNAAQHLGKMHNLWLDVALQLTRSNTARAKQIARYTLSRPEDKRTVFATIARDMLLGITTPTPDMAQAMQEEMLSVIPLLAPHNPEKALEYLRQINPAFIPQYMPHIIAPLALTNPTRAQELYNEVVKLADTPAHKENKAMIIGNITAARFGIPPFNEESYE
jgi:hypothetical protein